MNLKFIVNIIKRSFEKLDEFTYLCDKNGRIIYSINGLPQNSYRLDIIYDDWEKSHNISIKLILNNMCVYQHDYRHTNINDFARPLKLLMDEYELCVKSYVRENKINDILDESN